MKVLFLDIDGVVNCQSTFDALKGDKVIPLDQYMCFLVGKIMLDTDCKLVLSSSWRGYKEGEKEIEQRIGKIYDRTPHKPGIRGNEIQAWLDEHLEVTRYAILDDDADMKPWHLPNFFQTSWDNGLTKEIADAVTKHLK